MLIFSSQARRHRRLPFSRIKRLVSLRQMRKRRKTIVTLRQWRNDRSDSRECMRRSNTSNISGMFQRSSLNNVSHFIMLVTYRYSSRTLKNDRKIFQLLSRRKCSDKADKRSALMIIFRAYDRPVRVHDYFYLLKIKLRDFHF